MFTLRFFNRVKPVRHARLISNFPTLKDSKPTVSNTQQSTSSTTPSSNSSVMGPNLITPTNMDKKILVWMKIYKSVDEVPNKITYEAMDKAHNRFRIRVANYMMIGTLLGAIFAVYYGKKRASRGESLEQININWHRQMANVSEPAAEK